MKTRLILIAVLTYIFTLPAWAGRADTYIYAVNSVGNLLWFEHTHVNSNPAWGIKGQPVGNGWNFKQLFAANTSQLLAGNLSVDIYGIKPNGDLYYYQRGVSSWKFTGKQIGNGWNFKQIFAGDNGSIYAITNSGDLMFYRYTGLGNGNLTWAVTAKKIGTGWNFQQVFAGSDGTIFAVTRRGDLIFYKYGGAQNGSVNWPMSGKRIGTGFNFDKPFAGANYSSFPKTYYTIYGVNSIGQLCFNVYTGASNGSATWLYQSMNPIDNGWGGGNFNQIVGATYNSPWP